MLEAGGEFAATAMEALARIRDYKPTKTKQDGTEHRNAPLLENVELRAEKCQDAERAVDRLRPLRGRVNLVFAASSGPKKETQKQAGVIVGQLRAMLETSTKFWARYDKQPKAREDHEHQADQSYAAARKNAWNAVYAFFEAASKAMRSP